MLHPEAISCCKLAASVGTLCWILSGCSGPENYAITGRITLDASPLPDAFVAFVPTGEEGTWACGQTDSQGRYSLHQGADVQGTTLGSYSVRITTFREGNADVDPPIPSVPERVPEKYNLQTELTAVLTPQTTVFDFELESDREAAATADEARPDELPTLVSVPTQPAVSDRPHSRDAWYLVTVSIWLVVLMACFVWWRFNERRFLG